MKKFVYRRPEWIINRRDEAVLKDNAWKEGR